MDFRRLEQFVGIVSAMSLEEFRNHLPASLKISSSANLMEKMEAIVSLSMAHGRPQIKAALLKVLTLLNGDANDGDNGQLRALASEAIARRRHARAAAEEGVRRHLQARVSLVLHGEFDGLDISALEDALFADIESTRVFLECCLLFD